MKRRNSVCARILEISTDAVRWTDGEMTEFLRDPGNDIVMANCDEGWSQMDRLENISTSAGVTSLMLSS